MSRSTGTPATRLLAQRGVVHELLPYDHDPAAPSYGREAAEKLGIDPARVFKTLVVALEPGLAVAVVPVDGSLDLKACAAALGVKRAAMAEPQQVERTTGYVLGGVSPLGQKRALPTVLDRSALDHATICVSAGRRGLDVALAPDDLVALTTAVVAAIARRDG
jgi:Cys-tRNA(Pro)/Cys-tRNA(Cys) deacylase